MAAGSGPSGFSTEDLFKSASEPVHLQSGYRGMTAAEWVRVRFLPLPATSARQHMVF